MNDRERISREMQAADEIRAKRQDETLGKITGGIQGALNDAYRRLFENGWYQKDVFDGRFHWDHQTRSPGDGQFPKEQLGQGYGQSASFYGWDQKKEQQPAQEKDQQQYGWGMER